MKLRTKKLMALYAKRRNHFICFIRDWNKYRKIMQHPTLKTMGKWAKYYKTSRQNISLLCKKYKIVCKKKERFTHFKLNKQLNKDILTQPTKVLLKKYKNIGFYIYDYIKYFGIKREKGLFVKRKYRKIIKNSNLMTVSAWSKYYGVSRATICRIVSRFNLKCKTGKRGIQLIVPNKYRALFKSRKSPKTALYWSRKYKKSIDHIHAIAFRYKIPLQKMKPIAYRHNYSTAILNPKRHTINEWAVRYGVGLQALRDVAEKYNLSFKTIQEKTNLKYKELIKNPRKRTGYGWAKFYGKQPDTIYRFCESRHINL